MAHIDPYYFPFKGVGYPDNFQPIDAPDCFDAYTNIKIEGRIVAPNEGSFL